MNELIDQILELSNLDTIESAGDMQAALEKINELAKQLEELYKCL